MKTYEEWLKENPHKDPGPNSDRLMDEWMREFVNSLTAYTEDQVRECLDTFKTQKP